VTTVKLAPQAGPQTEFLGCPADIAIYGGAAGGGKTFALLLEPLRHHKNSRFGGVIFRRNTTMVRNEGGLWDESIQLYPLFRAKPREAFLEWKFPSGVRLKFAHLEHEFSVHDWQGSQVPFIGFDELTHFSENQFFYMLSRNRSTSGVPGYVRAGCNPDPDSWVRKFIDWWIGEDGYPRAERAGKIRYFIRRDDAIIWGDSKEEIYARYGQGAEIIPKSVTFIPSKVHDNKILLEKDPSYLANLHALNRVDRLRLLGGNWNVRASAGMLFKREWFRIIDAIPAGWISVCRYWDRAATQPNEGNRDPDWTRGCKLFKYANGTYVVADMRSLRDTPGKVEDLVTNTASHDGYNCSIYGEQDPGSAGVADAARFCAILAGFDVRIEKPTKDKVTRAKPVSAQSEAGNIMVLRAPWNDEFFTELENFSEELLGHDDQVDAFSGAFNVLTGNISIADVL
jgi:predicted phage terminase large subunit-like protein